MDNIQSITEDLNKIPNTLHKYFRIDKRFLEVIINNEIWFSDPFDFNDPYDCNLTTYANNTFEEIYNHLIHISQKHKFSINEQETRAKAERWSTNPKEFGEVIRKTEFKELENKGLTCFSKSDDMLLMWSHYANSHKGACLSFDRTKDLDFFYQLYNVDYPNAYPEINVIKKENNYKRYKFILATKSIDWEYEQEVRVVKDKVEQEKFRGYIKFKKESLESIKFGYKTDLNDIRTIKEIITRENYNHVKLFKAELKNGKYGIEFEPI